MVPMHVKDTSRAADFTPANREVRRANRAEWCIATPDLSSVAPIMYDRSMGVWFDYFAAPSDDAAAAMIDAVGGPGGARAITGPVKMRESASGTLVMQSGGIDPVVNLG